MLQRAAAANAEMLASGGHTFQRGTLDLLNMRGKPVATSGHGAHHRALTGKAERDKQRRAICQGGDAIPFLADADDLDDLRLSHSLGHALGRFHADYACSSAAVGASTTTALITGSAITVSMISTGAGAGVSATASTEAGFSTCAW